MSKPRNVKPRREPQVSLVSSPPLPQPPPPEVQAVPAPNTALARRAQKGHQVRERRDARGRLIERYEMKDGLLQGRRQIWSPTGQLLVETYYRNGKPHGLARTWNVHGQLVSRITYRNGRHSGPFTIWWDNGRIKEQGTYFNDRRVGWYVWFDADGTQLGRHHYAEPENVRRGRSGRHRRAKRGILTRLAHALGL